MHGAGHLSLHSSITEDTSFFKQIAETKQKKGLRKHSFFLADKAPQCVGLINNIAKYIKGFFFLNTRLEQTCQKVGEHLSTID